MNLKITKNKDEANLITHDGKFHPDDVFSTVFLSKYIENPCLYRIGVGPVENTNAIDINDYFFTSSKKVKSIAKPYHLCRNQNY